MTSAPAVQFLRVFPLGTVLFPHMVMPLRIFEPRYLQMVTECVEYSAQFGVVLIERGFEVGGGDQRFSVGTAATILDIAELADGQRLLAAAGTGRFEVTEWLPEDPYPAAMVRRMDDLPPPGAGSAPSAAEIAETDSLLRMVLALTSEMGQDVGSLSYQLSSDPDTAVYHMAALAPLGSLDAQGILEAPTTAARLQALRLALTETEDLLRAQLGGM